MCSDKMPKEPVAAPTPPDEFRADVPSLFATIHFRSEARPNGYTDKELEEINMALNPKRPKD